MVSAKQLDNLVIGKYYAYPDLAKINEKFNTAMGFTEACLELFDKKATSFRTSIRQLSNELRNFYYEGKYLQDDWNSLDFTKVKADLSELIDLGECVAGFGENDDFNGYIEELKTAERDIEELKTMLNKFETTENALITIKSKLVCRCGGVIEIIFDGSWIEKGKEQVIVNIRNLLKKIEADLYTQISKITGDSYPEENDRTSLIGGFQMVHSLLEQLGATSEYNNCPLLEEKGGIGSIDITIKPQSVIDKDATTTSGVKNLMGIIPFHIGDIITSIFAVNDLMSGDAGWGSYKDAVVEAREFADMGSPTFSEKFGILAEAAGKVNTLYSLFMALKDFAYVTNADYTGVIEIVVKTFVWKYTYKETYDIYGTVLQYAEPEHVRMSGPRDPIYWVKGLDNQAKFRYEIRTMGIRESGETIVPLSE